MFIISPEAEAFIKSLQWKFLFRNASHIIFYQWDQYMIVPLSREAVLIDCMIYWPQYNCEYPATNMTQQAGFPPINTWSSLWFGFLEPCLIYHWCTPQVYIHSQKELAHWAVDVTVEFYVCLFSISLMCNLWTVVQLHLGAHWWKSAHLTEDKQKDVWDDDEQWNEPILLRVYPKGIHSQKDWPIPLFIIISDNFVFISSVRCIDFHQWAPRCKIVNQLSKVDVVNLFICQITS